MTYNVFSGTLNPTQSINRQRHVSQFVVGFPAATETHTVSAVIPRHYHVTFLNCNNQWPSSGIATKATLKKLSID